MPTTVRPRIVAFDVIETTFSLEALRPRLARLGLRPSALEPWFARTLRDAFALAATGVYAGFADIASDTLLTLTAEHAIMANGPALKSVLDGFAELEPQPDATAAFRTLEAAGIGIVALSNGAAETTQRLLDRAGLAGFVQHVVSIAEIRAWKPLPAIYLHAAKRAGVAPGEMALVATHAWDVHGAKRAGLMTGFVARGQVFPSTMVLPDVVGESLAEVAARLA